MADGVFNRSKGRAVEFYNRIKSNDPANSAFIVVLLKVGETDAVLKNYANLGLLLGAAGNTEADFTNYARKVLTDTELAAFPAPDDIGDKYDIDLPDQTYTAAGGVLNNTLVRVLICYDSDTTLGTDTNIIPVSFHDWAPTTDGSDLTLQVAAAGFFSAT